MDISNTLHESPPTTNDPAAGVRRVVVTSQHFPCYMLVGDCYILDFITRLEFDVITSLRIVSFVCGTYTDTHFELLRTYPREQRISQVIKARICSQKFQICAQIISQAWSPMKQLTLRCIFWLANRSLYELRTGQVTVKGNP